MKMHASLFYYGMTCDILGAPSGIKTPDNVDRLDSVNTRFFSNTMAPSGSSSLPFPQTFASSAIAACTAEVRLVLHMSTRLTCAPLANNKPTLLWLIAGSDTSKMEYNYNHDCIISSAYRSN